MAWAGAGSAALTLLGLACVPTGLEFYWVVTDPIGFPIAMTNTPAVPGDAEVIWRASYEPFGLATEELDPDGDTKQVRMPLRFPGQWWDYAANTHYNFLRTYDPATGRYLEADPIAQRGGLQLYHYARNSPIGLADPLGLFGTRDFLKHYFRENPSPVYLGLEGLGPAFENAPSVGREVSAFNSRLDQEARAIAEGACGSCPSDRKATVGFSLAEPSTTNVTGQPGLYVVAHSTFLRKGSRSVSVDCSTGQYSYSCGTGFAIHDRFTDPLDLKPIFGPVELPGGTPYPIIYTFERSPSGTGKLR